MPAVSRPAPTARERSERIAFRRGLSLLALTLLVPGSAQVIAGGVGLGRFALKVWLAVVGGALAFVALALAQRTWAIALYAHPFTQGVVSVLALVLGVGWALLVLDAWRLSRPRSMGGRRHVMALVSGVLAVALGVGSVQASAMARSQAELFGNVFGGGGNARATDGRINVLLVGADAEPDRPGIRTDTMMVASVSETTGRTVLFSLPRNLQGAPFPRTSPLRSLYPRGFTCPDAACLLNAVHAEGEKRRDLYPGVKDPGMQATREAIAETLGLTINYHAVVDMRGFEDLVDALGGVRLDIAKAVPIGGGSAPVEGWIQPGRDVRLDGFHALWFARSRHGASDYERMARQKCVVNALAKQASPVNVVTRFTALASAGGEMVATDIPSTQLGRLAELADAGRRLPIASTSFAPPLIEPARPDLRLIRSTVKDAVAASEELDQQAARAAREAERAAKAERAGKGEKAAKPAPVAATPQAGQPAPQPAPATASEHATSSGSEVQVGSKPAAGGSFSEERRTDDLEAICGVS